MSETPPNETDHATPATCEPAQQSVLRWITEGHNEESIRDALRTRYPDADCERVIAAAVAELRSDGQCDRDLIRGWAFRGYREIYRRCLDIGDFDGARKAMKEVVQLAR